MYLDGFGTKEIIVTTVGRQILCSFNKCSSYLNNPSISFRANQHKAAGINILIEKVYTLCLKKGPNFETV